jgi:hypothetical protein
VKLFKLSLVLLLLIPSSANAAIKVAPVAPAFNTTLGGKPGDQITGAVVTPTSLIVGTTIENSTTGITTAGLISFGFDGIKQWELPVPVESVSGQLIKDKTDSIYLLGSASSPQITPPVTPTESPMINPDNVTTEPVVIPKNTLNNLAVWKVSISGQLLQTFTLPINEAVIPKSIVLTATGLKIGANTASKYLEVTMDQNGVFGKITNPKAPKPLVVDETFKYKTSKLRYYISTKAISGIPSWKPKIPTPVLIQYSKAGSIKAANYFQGNPLFAFYQAGIGVIAITESTTGYGISIVKPLD